MKALREAYGEALVAAGEKFPDVLALSCDVRSPTKVQLFFDALPERALEMGISEANGIGVAAGLALSGYRPFITSFGAFITGKNVEIRTSIAYNMAPVVVVGTHGGLIGPDGATQAGLQDITVMRSIPGFQVYQPASPIATFAIVDHAASTRDLVYLRIARNVVPELYDDDYTFTPGRGHIVHDGDEITIISSGPPVHAALEYAKGNSKRSVRVVDLPSIKPIDSDLILRCARETRAIVVVEDHWIYGGLGSAVAEVTAAAGVATPVICHGIDDTYTESARPAELERAYGMDAEGIGKVADKA